MIAQMSKAATTYWAAFILMDILLITGHSTTFPTLDVFHTILWAVVAYIISRIFAGWAKVGGKASDFFKQKERKHKGKFGTPIQAFSTPK